MRRVLISQVSWTDMNNTGYSPLPISLTALASTFFFFYLIQWMDQCLVPTFTLKSLQARLCGEKKKSVGGGMEMSYCRSQEKPLMGLCSLTMQIFFNLRDTTIISTAFSTPRDL